MTTSGSTSGCRTGRGLKPSLAAVYSARQQRSENHSRQSSPGIRGGGFLTDSCPFLSTHSAPTSPTGALNIGVTWKQAVGDLGRSATRSVGRGREARKQQSQAAPMRQCSHNSQDSSTSQDSSKSASVESSGGALKPAPPQTFPTRKSGGSLHSQRRVLALPGVTEINSTSPLRELGSPRTAWQVSPRERSRGSSPEDFFRFRRMREQRSRDGSITPVMSPVPPCLQFPSSPSRALPGGGKCFSPRPPGTEGTNTQDVVGLTSQTSFLQMAPSDVQRGDAPHEADMRSNPFNVERLQSLLAAAAVGCRTRGRDLSPAREELASDECSQPVLREGWQVSLCHNVVLCCPSKLPTKDAFAQRKVPRPVSLEGSLKSCDPDSLSSPPSPPSPLLPRGPSTERSTARPRREGRSFHRRPLEEAKTPDEDMNMRDARIQLLMQERRLSSASLYSPIYSPRRDATTEVKTSTSVFPKALNRGDTCSDGVHEHLSDKLYEVKLEIVRGLAAASSTRKFAQDNIVGD